MTHQNAVELESHLRESIADLVAKGLREREAFMIASLRLGTPDMLSREFCKVNGNYVWKGRTIWMLFGFVGGSAFASTFAGIAAIAGATTAFVGLSGTSTGLVSIAATVVCWTILFWSLWQGGQRVQTGAIDRAASFGWLASLVALSGFGHGLSIVGRTMHISKVTVEEFGKSAYWTSIGGLVINVCVVAACIAIIVLFGRSRLEQTERVA